MRCEVAACQTSSRSRPSASLLDLSRETEGLKDEIISLLRDLTPADNESIEKHLVDALTHVVFGSSLIEICFDGHLLRQALDASQLSRELTVYRPAIRKGSDRKKRNPNRHGYLSYLVSQRILSLPVCKSL
jgi:hypothetical protein